MGLPKFIQLGDERSGIQVEYIKRRKALYLFGWYDHCVGIEGGEIALLDFCKQLGINGKDLKELL